MTPEELYEKEFGTAESVPKQAVIQLFEHFAEVLELERNRQTHDTMVGERVEAKNNIGEMISPGDTGLITAYLPLDNIFAIDFGDGRWYTFEYSEDWFWHNFERCE